MVFHPSQLRHPPARSAHAACVVLVSVFRRELVAAYAMRLALVLRRDRIATKYVLCRGYDVEVFRVDARRIPAQVIDRHALWYRPLSDVHPESVRIQVPMLPVDQLAADPITRRISRARPLPAPIVRRKIDLRDEPFPHEWVTRCARVLRVVRTIRGPSCIVAISTPSRVGHAPGRCQPSRGLLRAHEKIPVTVSVIEDPIFGRLQLRKINYATKKPPVQESRESN